MVTRQHPTDLGPSAPQLYVIIPPFEAIEALADQLAGALDGGDVAAVLVRLPQVDAAALTERAKMLASRVQAQGVALLLDDHPEIAVQAQADGAHAVGVNALRRALDLLKPDRMVGAGGLAARHDAMEAGEAGVDYVMFGEPDADGRRPAFDAILERVAWWAELFVVPCVAYAASLDEIAPLCEARADFIAIENLVFSDPRGPRAAIDDVTSRMRVVETAR
jgi:thiamine-phosphate pyrophosphorylase